MKQASRSRINLKIPELFEGNETLSVFQGCHTAMTSSGHSVVHLLKLFCVMPPEQQAEFNSSFFFFFTLIFSCFSFFFHFKFIETKELKLENLWVDIWDCSQTVFLNNFNLFIFLNNFFYIF